MHQKNGSHHNMKPPLSATNLSQLASTNRGVTYAKQDALPRLPIPDLALTLERFQARLAALQTESQRAETARVVREFLQGDGPILHQALTEYEAAGRAAGVLGSYVEEFWNESYLAPDTSVVLNLNPYFVLEGGPDPKIASDQLRRAASLCFASIKLAAVLKLEELTPDVFRGAPLCMHQFKALFGSSRQPTLNDLDDVHVFNDSTHVAVLCKNQFYYFFALWPENGAVAVDESDIMDILEAIQKDADQTDLMEQSQTALGVFTSLPRSKWAVARQELCQNESNELALRMIDSALFVLVLDDYIAPDIHTAAANMLHGANVMHGTMQIGSCLNRWYDKLQLIVCSDGTSGLIFEHSIIDGHTALRFVSDTFAETVITFAESIIDLIHGRGLIAHVVNAVVERAVVRNRAGTGSLDVFPKKLVFELSESIVDQIYYAETALCDEIHASDTYVLEYKQFGKRLIVANNLSPDALVQMSILLAYYKLYGKVDCMYEPALTKHFYHGRTEAIRGTTTQAKHFCEVWCHKKSTSEEKLESLRQAITEHSRLTKEASAGQGVDRLLFALKCIALRMNEGSVPPFFRSEAWKTLNHTVLSTSNCGNPALRLFGFGPVVPDGFGIGYIIKDNAISYSVCSKRRQTYRYVQSLERCLNEIQSLLRPISSVSVEAERPLRRDESGSNKAASEASYGDIWGENDAPERAPRNEETFLLPSRNPSFVSYSPRIREQSIRGDLLAVSSIDILFNGGKTTADQSSS